MTRQNIFLIDDHPLIREGMTKVIEKEPDLFVSGELGSSKGAVDIILNSNPDVILLDLSLSDGSGIELIKDFRAAGIESFIIVVSIHDEALYAERVLRAGANGYLMKDKAASQVIQSIRSVLKDEIYLSDAMQRDILSKAVGRKRNDSSRLSIDLLTDRELEVFELFGRGMSSLEIARHLNLSPKTVESHRTNMKAKLGIVNSHQMLHAAIRWIETGALDTSTVPD